MHLVYYCKSPGEEFRYSLRSAAAHLPVSEVTVIGDAPSWLKKAKVLDGNPTANPQINSVANAHIAARAFKDDFTIFNDDFFVLKDREYIPSWHFLTLTAHMGLYRDPKSAHWRKLYLETAQYLTHKQVMLPKSFELHIPMTVNGAALDQVLTASASDPHLQGPGLWRSLYGNLVLPTTAARDDVKVHTLDDFNRQTDFASTDERTARNILPVLRDLFPERSPWEKR